MATTRIALGSVLGTVTNAAEAVSSVFNTATKSIGMLDAFVTKAADEQKEQHIKDKLVFRNNLLREHAMEQSKNDLQIVEFCNQSTTHKELFQKHYDELSNLLNPQPKEA